MLAFSPYYPHYPQRTPKYQTSNNQLLEIPPTLKGKTVAKFVHELTVKLIEKHPLPKKNFDLLVDTRQKALAVRIYAKGTRSYVALNRKPYIDKQGRPNTKADDLTLNQFGAISLDAARQLAGCARDLYLELGDKDAVAAQLAATPEANIAAKVQRATSETLEERRGKYFAYHIGKEKRPWKEKTIKLNTGTWNNHILPALGPNRPVDDVTTEDVDALLADLSKGRVVQRRIWEALNHFRNWNENRRTPVSYLKPIIAEVAPATKKLAGTEPLTLPQIRAVGRRCWEIVENPEKHGVRAVRLAKAHLATMYSALRIDSLMSLKADGVIEDEDGQPLYLHIPASDMKGSYPSNFSVPVSRGLRRVLDVMEADENETFFRTYDQSTFGDLQGPVMNEPLGFKFSFHTWRHTMSTWAGNLDVNQETIEIALAHSLNKATGSATASRYNHSDDWRRTRKLWGKYGDFLDFLIWTDVSLSKNGMLTEKNKAEFKRWRKGGRPLLRVVS